MHTIRSVLSRKDRAVVSVSSTDTVLHAIRLMASQGIGALLVIDDGELVGLLSERDYARKVILKGLRSDTTKVADIMSRELVTISPDHSAEQGLDLMTERFVRHLPVMEDGRLVGLVSIGDLVKWVIRDQKLAIEELERYVSS